MRAPAAERPPGGRWPSPGISRFASEPIPPEVATIRHVLFFNRSFYFDDSNGAAVASRALLQALARRGFAVEALTGTLMETGRRGDPAEVLAERGLEFRPSGEPGAPAESPASPPPHLALDVDGVAVTIHRRDLRRYQAPDPAEAGDLLRLLDSAFDRSAPGVLLTYGGDPITAEALARARRRGVATVFAVHNFHYRHPAPFADVDAVLTPSRFAADFYRESLGLPCTALPNPIDPGRIEVEAHAPRYVTFVTPTIEKGVYAFARIADELGRRRPDIPLLVVEGRGTEDTVAACGLDLGRHGNLHVMPHTPDPRDFWEVTRACLMPSLWWENQPLVAVEAMANGIPVVGSDRGGLPETLGAAGVVLPLPGRLTASTRLLPTPEEVAPWVEVVIRFHDDAAFYDDHRRRARAEASRWAPGVLEPQYARFFADLRPGPGPPAGPPPGRAKSVVLVPYLGGIEPECEQGLLALERAGVRVVRRAGSSQVDVARNELLSDALHDGFEAILFVDADLGFDPLDALRLLARPEPVVAGVYARGGRRELAGRFADGIAEVAFGPAAQWPYPLDFAATGFLRLRAGVLRRMVEQLGLPLCDTRWRRGSWPFFLPMVVRGEDRGHHYLGGDWAFSHRLGLLGVVPLADTSIRLWHYGRCAYGWEDAGREPPPRFPNYTCRLGGGGLTAVAGPQPPP